MSIITAPVVHDPALYRVPDDFRRSWLYVGHDAEVAEPGDYVRRVVGGRPLFLVQGGDGETRVLYNTCTHRGALVCRQDRGNAATFQCFYHAWTFDNRGELVGVPGEEAYGRAWNRDELALRSPARHERHAGLWFCAYDDDVASLNAAAAALDGWAAALPPGAALQGTQRFAVAADWTLLIRVLLQEHARGRDVVGSDQHLRLGDAVYLHPNLLVTGGEAPALWRVEPLAGDRCELSVTVLGDMGRAHALAAAPGLDRIEDVELAQRAGAEDVEAFLRPPDEAAARADAWFVQRCTDPSQNPPVAG